MIVVSLGSYLTHIDRDHGAGRDDRDHGVGPGWPWSGGGPGM